jgi:hypothetical protein
MARLIGGVVLGYVAMVAAVFAGLTGAWFAMGADRAFQPGGRAPGTAAEPRGVPHGVVPG